MAGYVRQSVADLINGADVTAPPLTAEFNQLASAFDAAAGHTHDGGTGNAPAINLTTSVSGYLQAANGGIGGKHNPTATTVPVVTNDNTQGYAPGSIWENATTGRVYICVGNITSAAVWRELVQVTTGNAIIPATHDHVDIGSPTVRFQDLYLSGGASILGTLAVGTNLTVAGTTTVTSAATFDGALIANSVDIGGGTIDTTQIGATTPSTVTGTTVTAANFVGPIAGAVTGDLTGNVTGNVTGDVTGDVTGNITAGSGTSSFTNVTINGSLNMNAGTASTITGLSNPVLGSDAATKTYVDAEVSAVIDAAPGALDTLNELAAALGDDANYATTTTNALATKLPLAGGTMSGTLAMGTSKITGLGTPTAGTDATTKSYVDAGDALKVTKSGDTMSGVLAMGANKITGVADPTLAQDVATKTYVDVILGSATNAATSAGNAATSATAAANSATAAATSESNAATTTALTMGAGSSNPTTATGGGALVTGALFFNTTDNAMKVYNGTSWVDAGSAVNGTAERNTYTATASQTTFVITYDVGFVDVYLNGIKLLVTADFTATSGTNIVLTTGATVGDIVDIIAYGTFNVANTYTPATADAKFAQVANNLSDLGSAATARTNLGLAIGTDVQAYDATIVVDADIGSTVQAFDATIVVDADIGTTVQAYDATIVVDADIGVSVQAYDADTSKLDVAETRSASSNFADNVLQSPEIKDYSETVQAMTANDVDCTLGNVQTKSISGAVTLTFSNPPATGKAGSFTLIATLSATPVITWPASVKWAGGTAPDTVAGIDVFSFMTTDAGTNWLGFTAGQGLA